VLKSDYAPKETRSSSGARWRKTSGEPRSRTRARGGGSRSGYFAAHTNEGGKPSTTASTSWRAKRPGLYARVQDAPTTIRPSALRPSCAIRAPLRTKARRLRRPGRVAEERIGEDAVVVPCR